MVHVLEVGPGDLAGPADVPRTAQGRDALEDLAVLRDEKVPRCRAVRGSVVVLDPVRELLSVALAPGAPGVVPDYAERGWNLQMRAARADPLRRAFDPPFDVDEHASSGFVCGASQMASKNVMHLRAMGRSS